VTSLGRRRLLTAAVTLVLAGVAAYVLYGSGAELTEAAQVLSRVNPAWLVLAAAAEAASFVAFAQGELIFLSSAGRSVTLPAMTGIVTAGQAIANCIPAGIAASSIYTFRQLLARRIDVLLSAEVQVAQSLVYVATLALLALAGTALAGGTRGVADLQYVALGLFAVTALLLGGGIWLHRRGSVRRTFQKLVRWLSPDPKALARRGLRLEGVGGIQLEPVIWTRAAVAATGSWVFDCTCLAASFLAVGSAPPWRGLLLAYCAGQMATILPVSPGGLGVVEGSLTVALVAFGGSEPTTLAAVLLYRLFSYWAVLPGGLISHLLVRRPVKEPA
jgi:uncharacterized membrane protein YbhN (UPF0104 family)